jgi:hypothetical protein
MELEGYLTRNFKALKMWSEMQTKFYPHCGKRTGFQVKFNIVCRIGDKEENGYLRICQDCGGRSATTQKVLRRMR